MLPKTSMRATLRKADATALASSGVQYADPIRRPCPLKRILTPYLLTIFPRVLVTLDGSFFSCFPSQGGAFDEGSPNGLVLPDIFTIQAVSVSVRGKSLSVQRNAEGRFLKDCDRRHGLLNGYYLCCIIKKKE